jgi:hypothetical protein
MEISTGFGGAGWRLLHRRTVRQFCAVADRTFPAVETLVRRVQCFATNRPDPWYILAQTFGMAGTIGMDRDVVLGILVEGAVQTLIQHIPEERQAEAAETLLELRREQLKSHPLPRVWYK